MNLYIRLLITLLKSLFAKPVDYRSPQIKQERIVLLNDLDLNKHMNNGRYLTILDLASIELFVRLGFIPVMSRLNAHVVSGGSLITYRKQLKFLEKYSVELSYIGSTEAWHVMEFSFKNEKGALCAKGLLKGAFVSKKEGLIKTAKILKTFENIHNKEIVIKDLPQHAQKWLESEEAQPLNELTLY